MRQTAPEPRREALPWSSLRQLPLGRVGPQPCGPRSRGPTAVPRPPRSAGQGPPSSPALPGFCPRSPRGGPPTAGTGGAEMGGVLSPCTSTGQTPAVGAGCPDSGASLVGPFFSVGPSVRVQISLNVFHGLNQLIGSRRHPFANLLCPLSKSSQPVLRNGASQQRIIQRLAEERAPSPGVGSGHPLRTSLTSWCQVCSLLRPCAATWWSKWGSAACAPGMTTALRFHHFSSQQTLGTVKSPRPPLSGFPCWAARPTTASLSPQLSISLSCNGRPQSQPAPSPWKAKRRGQRGRRGRGGRGRSEGQRALTGEEGRPGSQGQRRLINQKTLPLGSSNTSR